MGLADGSARFRVKGHGEVPHARVSPFRHASRRLPVFELQHPARGSTAHLVARVRRQRSGSGTAVELPTGRDPPHGRRGIHRRRHDHEAVWRQGPVAAASRRGGRGLVVPDLRIDGHAEHSGNHPQRPGDQRWWRARLEPGPPGRHDRDASRCQRRGPVDENLRHVFSAGDDAARDAGRPLRHRRYRSRPDQRRGPPVERVGGQDQRRRRRDLAANGPEVRRSGQHR